MILLSDGFPESLPLDFVKGEGFRGKVFKDLKPVVDGYIKPGKEVIKMEDRIIDRARDIAEAAIRTAPEDIKMLIQMNPVLNDMLHIVALWSADEAIRMTAKDAVKTTK